jgi:glutaminyl-peptide cyclotransferase
MKSLYLFFYVLILFTCNFALDKVVKHSRPVILRTFRHDPAAFTQGLVYVNGIIYESTGLYGSSSIRAVDPQNGNILRTKPVQDIFGEGLAEAGGTLIQLSWKEHTAIAYSINDFAMQKTFVYQGEGWGLASYPAGFIMSNGSDTLFLRSKNFSIIKKIPVTLNGKPAGNLNELEYVNGTVYANIWYKNYIAAIDLSSGKIKQIIDCSSSVQKENPQSEDNVLNGIAYNPDRKTFYITGKHWQYMFEVKW